MRLPEGACCPTCRAALAGGTPGLALSTSGSNTSSVSTDYGTASVVPLLPCTQSTGLNSTCGAAAITTSGSDISQSISAVDVTPCPSGVTCPGCDIGFAQAGLCPPGTYLFLYRARDSQGQAEASALRIVQVQNTYSATVVSCDCPWVLSQLVGAHRHLAACCFGAAILQISRHRSDQCQTCIHLGCCRHWHPWSSTECMDAMQVLLLATATTSFASTQVLASTLLSSAAAQAVFTEAMQQGIMNNDALLATLSAVNAASVQEQLAATQPPVTISKAVYTSADPVQAANSSSSTQWGLQIAVSLQLAVAGGLQQVINGTSLSRRRLLRAGGRPPFSWEQLQDGHLLSHRQQLPSADALVQGRAASIRRSSSSRLITSAAAAAADSELQAMPGLAVQWPMHQEAALQSGMQLWPEPQLPRRRLLQAYTSIPLQFNLSQIAMYLNLQPNRTTAYSATSSNYSTLQASV